MERVPAEAAGEELAEAIERIDPAAPIASSGQRTASIAAQLLVGKGVGFVIPSGPQRQNLLVAFAKTGAVVYGRAFDVVRLNTPLNLDDEAEISRNLKAVTLYEIKSTRKNAREDFVGHFFSLSTAELLVAQSLKTQFRFAFVNVVTGDFLDLSLTEIFGRAKGIYPTWSISF